LDKHFGGIYFSSPNVTGGVYFSSQYKLLSKWENLKIILKDNFGGLK
jgi:hypothetical protein